MERGEPVTLSELRTLAECQLAIDRVLEMSPANIARNDIAILNLLCAPALPGSENLNILKCLGRVGNVTAFVRDALIRNRDHLRAHPNYDCEAKEIMSLLITKVKRDYGAAYSPTAAEDLLAGKYDAPFSDSSEVLIHGLLSDDQCRRWGTCTSIPVLITAVARQLGFPVRLAVTGRHVFCRWDDGNGTCFNIEASNPQGMTIPTDEEYRKWPMKLTLKELESGHFLRSLSPAEEFALFIKGRLYCMLDGGQYDDMLRWIARAMIYAPDDPNFYKDAIVMLDTAIKHRHWRKFPDKRLPACNDRDQPFFRIGKYLKAGEGSCWFTIMAHHSEQKGNLRQARGYFEDACRYANPAFNEHRDFQRFLKKHNLKQKAKPLLPPKKLCVNRFFRLTSALEEQADELRRIADNMERKGELLMAHDAMRDLYLFDPSDNELFWRYKTLEDNAWLQAQLQTQLASNRRAYQQIGKSFSKFNNGTKMAVHSPSGPLKTVKPYEDRELFTVRT